MNILIPHTWLLEHLDTQATPDQIAQLLSLSGPSVERIYNREGESVYDIEITSNRVDCISIRGIAREAAVILTYAGIPSQLKPQSTYNLSLNSNLLPLPTIQDPFNLSKRTNAIVLNNVAHSPTPDWMAKRLRQIDQNVHYASIDITNYTTHEIGHPCHAFDYDKIMNLGGQINIIQATPDMEFTTLDGESYKTLGGEVVFTNDKNQIIDLPAIKGTLNSAVDDNTTRILLWIESLPAHLIRQASMNHNIRTIAAQLNEKNVDPTLTIPTIELAVHLYQDLTQATIASNLIDIYHQPHQSQPINLSLSRIQTYLGIEIPPTQITQILNDLECQASLQNDELTVTPPSFRPDLLIDADIIEEIARIYGYAKLPSVLMSGPIPTQTQPEVDFSLEHRIKQYLSASHWQEVYTYSLVSQSLADQAKQFINKDSQPLKLANPLTDDRVYLRQSLIPSLAEVLTQNPTVTDLQVFEIANVYHPIPHQTPNQELHLTLLSPLPYRQVRTQIEHLLNSLFISNIQVNQTNSHATISTTINNQLVQLGTIYSIANLTAFDFEFSQIILASQTHPHLKPNPTYPANIQDFTFKFPNQIHIGPVINSLRSIPNVTQVEYLDTYQNNSTFRIYFQDLNRNLTDQDIQPLRTQISNLILQKHQGTLK